MHTPADESERFRPTDLPLWLAIYAGFALTLLAIWPFFLVKNFFKLIGSRTLFGAGIALIVLDQLSKWGMWHFLGGVPGNRVVLIPGYLDLTLVTNLGAAFGLFPGETKMFIMMALFTIGIIVAYLTMIGEDEKLVRVALVCIMAGAIGNLIDRVFLGHVIDFIDAHWGPHHWPVFNLADTIINIGVGLIVIDVIRDFARTRGRVPAAS